MDTIVIEVGDVDVKFPYVADGVVISGDDAEIEIVQLGEIVVPEVVGFAVGPKGDPGIIHYTPEFEEARDEAIAAAQAAAASEAAAAQSEHNTDLSETAADQSRATAAQKAIDAATSAQEAKDARDITIQAKNDGVIAKDAAVAAQGVTETARDAAITAKNDAQTAKIGADAAQIAAEAAQALAEGEHAAAELEADRSAQSASDALAYKNAAATSANAASDSATAADASAGAALQSKNDAATSASDAATTKGDVDQAKTDTVAAKNAAQTAQTASETARDGAQSAKAAAETARDVSLQAVTDAQTAQTGAETAQTAAEAAQAYAETTREVIEELVGDLDGVDLTAFATKGANGSDFTDPAQFRINLNLQVALPTVDDAAASTGSSLDVGLWSPAAVRLNVSTYAAQKVHTHPTSDIDGLDDYLTAFVRKDQNGSDFDDPNQVRVTIGAHASMDLVTQEAAEAGTETVERSWTAKRVAQAINAQATGALTPVLETKAPKDSPSFVGSPTAPTPAQGDFGPAIATTEFVQIAIGDLKVGAPELYDTLAKIGTWLEANDTELASAISFKADASQVYTKAQVDAAIANAPHADATPVGTLIFRTKSDTPLGYLPAEGGTFDQAVYPDLYAFLGTNVLPDMRDRVPRGTGTLAGAAGTTQEDALQNITGKFKVAGQVGGIDGASGVFAISDTPGYYPNSWTSTTNAAVGYGNFDASRVARTATETRVKSAVGRFFIKAYSAVTNPSTLDMEALAQKINALPAISATWPIDVTKLGGVVAANYALKTDLTPYFPVAGGLFGGAVTFAGIQGNSAQGDATGNVTIQNLTNASTGDSAMAVLKFLCNGTYGIKMHLRPDGYFGLGGWSSAAWRWYSAADGTMVASGNIAAYSDPRLKDDVEEIDGALDIIKSLRGVRFTWNHRTTLIGRPGERDIGILADEVEAVLPEIVGRSIPDPTNDDERWKIVAYDKLTPVLIQAVKELSARIEQLEGRVV
jgi:hypothetical protein